MNYLEVLLTLIWRSWVRVHLLCPLAPTWGVWAASGISPSIAISSTGLLNVEPFLNTLPEATAQRRTFQEVDEIEMSQAAALLLSGLTSPLGLPPPGSASPWACLPTSQWAPGSWRDSELRAASTFLGVFLRKKIPFFPENLETWLAKEMFSWSFCPRRILWQVWL